MGDFRAWGFCVAFHLVFELSASAAPLSYAYTASEFVGLGGLGYWTPSVTLPDLSQGGTVTLGIGIPDAIGPWAPDSNGTIHQTIDNGFSFQLRYGPTGSPQDLLLPRLDIEGHVSGNLYTTPVGDRHGGDFVATLRSINLINPQGSTDIPQPLLDLLAHPDRIQISASSPGYALSQFTTMLTILPQSPGSVSEVAEPTALATVLLAAGGIAVRRLRKCKH
jgi:hypothetical protein